MYGTTPGSTYTAVGFHKAIADLWDYQPSYPYHTFYYDNYNFSSFQNQGIYAPWYYYFLSPGFQPIQRNTAPIPVGSTYDLDSVSTSGSAVEFVNVAVDDGTPVIFESGSDAQLEGVRYKATVNAGCGGERFKVVVKFNLPVFRQLLQRGKFED